MAPARRQGPAGGPGEIEPPPYRPPASRFLCSTAIVENAELDDKIWTQHFRTKLHAICVRRVCKRGRQKAKGKGDQSWTASPSSEPASPPLPSSPVLDRGRGANWLGSTRRSLIDPRSCPCVRGRWAAGHPLIDLRSCPRGRSVRSALPGRVSVKPSSQAVCRLVHRRVRGLRGQQVRGSLSGWIFCSGTGSRSSLITVREWYGSVLARLLSSGRAL